MRIYLIRHGDPDYENDTITDRGRLEAVALAKRMGPEGLSKIYTSPLGRARATMEYTAQDTGLPWEVEEWTREIPGLSVDLDKWGKQAAWDTPGEVIFGKKPYPSRDNWHEMEVFQGVPVKEKYDYIASSSDEFLARQGYERVGGLYRATRPNNDKIALFAHAGFGMTWLAHLLNIPVPLVWCGFFLPTSSVTTILFEMRSEELACPRCVGIGDVSHLYAAGLEVNDSGIKGNFY